MPRSATQSGNAFKIKLCFVREVKIDKDIKEVASDDFSRNLVVTDKNGQVITIQLKGSQRSDLLVKGLNE